MYIKVLLALNLAIIASGISVETKLDFIGEKQEKPEKIYIKKVENKKDDKGEVVCGNGGCNITKTKLEASDSIATDVIVEVKTNVDLNENKNKTVEDVPDVPIVIGLGGIDQNIHNHINPPENFLNPNEIATNINRAFPDIGNHVKNGNNFIPSIGYPQVNIEVKPIRPLIVAEDRGYNYNNVNPGWYPRRQHNPLFNNNGRPNWRTPTPWNNGYPNYRPTSLPGWTTCNCLTNNWRPTQPTYTPQPGTQINNKLGSFN